jgi:sugar lactone lactonase YvrE
VSDVGTSPRRTGRAWAEVEPFGVPADREEATSIEHLDAVRNQLGEAPLWSSVEQALYWVDIDEPAIYRYDDETGELRRFQVEIPVTALGLRASGGLVVATRDGFAFLTPGSPLQMIADPESDRPDTRFNDGAVDPTGRFWAGTVSGDATASLYRLDRDLSVQRMDSGFTVSNGIGWSPDGRTLYFTDTLELVIHAYDFDPTSGRVANRRVFASVPAGEGVPDGLAVDEEGFVWSVRCRGGRIVRYDPSGRVDRQIYLPVSCPTSCAFGGAGLDELFVTSSVSLVNEANRSGEPLAGDLFRLRPGVRGISEPEFTG